MNAQEQLLTLIDRLEAARARLEQTDDPEAATEVLAELAELAKEVQAQIEQLKREES